MLTNAVLLQIYALFDVQFTGLKVQWRTKDVVCTYSSAFITTIHVSVCVGGKSGSLKTGQCVRILENMLPATPNPKANWREKKEKKNETR